jgi:hypothetical protein
MNVLGQCWRVQSVGKVELQVLTFNRNKQKFIFYPLSLTYTHFFKRNTKLFLYGYKIFFSFCFTNPEDGCNFNDAG